VSQEYIDAFKNAAATVYRVDSSQILVEARLAAPPRRRRLLHTGPHVVLDLKATIRNSVVSVNSKAAKRAAEQVAETLASDATVVANNGGFALNVRVLRVTDSDFEVQEEGLDEGDEIASGNNGTSSLYHLPFICPSQAAPNQNKFNYIHPVLRDFWCRQATESQACPKKLIEWRDYRHHNWHCRSPRGNIFRPL